MSNPGVQPLQWNTSTSTSDGANWLTVSPQSGNVAAQGAGQPVKIGVNSSTLLSGVYSGWVIFTNAGTQAVLDSPQRVFVSLTVLPQSPALHVRPKSLTFNLTTGTSSKPITIGNSGSQPLNWSADLGAGAPSFVSLSATSGSNLAGEASTSTNVIVNATGVTGGQTFTTSVTVNAVDPSTCQATAGSPATVAITINIVAPAIQLSTTTLSFTATQGSNGQQSSIASHHYN